MLSLAPRGPCCPGETAWPSPGGHGQGPGGGHPATLGVLTSPEHSPWHPAGPRPVPAAGLEEEGRASPGPRRQGGQTLIAVHCTPTSGSRTLPNPQGPQERGVAGSPAGAMRAAALPSAGVSRNHLPSDKTPGGPVKGHSARARMRGAERPEEGAVELGSEGSNGSATLWAQNRTDARPAPRAPSAPCLPRTPQSPCTPAPAPHLLVGSGGEHLLLVGVLGEVEGVGHHQVTPVEAGGQHEGGGPHPLHDRLGLGGHLARTEGAA